MSARASAFDNTEKSPLQMFITEGYERILTRIDAVFGSYLVVLTGIALWAWLQGNGSLNSVLALVGFMGINGLFSLASIRWRHVMWVETARIVAGALLAPAAYLLAAGMFMRWWPGFLIMCLGGNIFVGLNSGSPRWGRLLVVYYVALFALTETLTPPPHDWYAFAVNAGVVAMLGLLFAEIVALLGATLTSEREQRHQLVFEKAKSETMLQQEAADALRTSEAYFRSLIENSSDGIAIFDRQGTFRYVSPGLTRIVGWDAAELMGQAWHALAHPDDLPRTRGVFHELFENPGQVITHENRFRHKDGSWRVFETVGKLHPDGRVVTNSRDITERRKAQEQLRESEALYRTLIETSDSGIAIVAPEGTLRYINPAYERTLGYRSAELIGQPYAGVVHPDDLPQAGAIFAQLYQDPRQPAKATVRALHKDGGWRWLEGVARVMPDGNLVAYNRDVTEQRLAEEKLRESEARFRTVVEISTEGIVLVDTDGRYLYTSPAFERITGFTQAELLGQPFMPQIYPDDLPVVMDRFGRLLAGLDTTVTAEYRFTRKDGAVRVISGIGQILPNGQLVAFVSDITERRQLEDSLRLAELRFRAIFEQPLLAVRIYTADGRLREWNEAQAQMYQLTGEQLQAMGQTYNVLEDADAERLGYLPNIQRVFAGEAISFPPLLRNTAQGQKIWVQAFMYPVKDNAGVVREVVSVSQNVTPQKQAEEALRRLNEDLEQRVAERAAESQRLAAIVEATSDIVATVDVQGPITYLNQAGRQLFGINQSADLRQFNLADFYPPQALPIIQQRIGANMVQGIDADLFESVVRHHDGREIPVSIVGIIHRTSHGAPASLSAVIRDISEQKRAETELKTAKDAADTANQAKSTFLANMSHEIRTPMNAVIGMTSLLLNTALDAKQRDFVETIRTSGDALLTVINDILDFSKIEADRLELVNRPFDLRDTVEDSLDLLAPKAAEKGLDLAYFVEDDVATTWVGDVTRLRQILVNLIGNAVKFTERGEVVVSVSAQSKGLSDESTQSSAPPLRSAPGANVTTLHFQVRDTGLGIPPDKMGRLFQSFSQVDASLTRQYGGTGLGLAISKRLSELMGGTMWAESDGVPGHGATFHFTLEAEAAATPARSRLQNRLPELAGQRLLIVDDNATNRRILTLQTQTWGMTPVEAATPQEALNLIRNDTAFDLAILDVHMPEMDGVTLAEEICQAVDRRLPLIMLTSLGHDVYPEVEAVACYAAHLTKPVKPSQLYNVILEALSLGDQTLPPPAPTPSEPAALVEQLPLRILLAEDVLVNQKFALLALEDLGYTADVAANGREAVEAVHRQPYDVILMDVQMPELDGLEATRRVRQGWTNPAQPYIIAMTANAMQGDREMCLDAGMDDYISKPVYLEELRAALQRAGQHLRDTAPALVAGPPGKFREATNGARVM